MMEDHPGRVVNGPRNWGPGFMPATYQGTPVFGDKEPIRNLSLPKGVSETRQRAKLDFLNQLNQRHLEPRRDQTELDARIQSYELAFRMQVSVPEVMDITRESPQTLEAYGAQPGASSFANNCLLARRLAENGVRYVQLFDWGWDFHGTGPGEDIRDGLTRKCATMDKPVAALIRDLKDRGMLDETLIIWGGEFGRTPFREGRTAGGNILGRDHYPDCYTMWLAGGGAKRSFSYGETDELGFSITRDKVHVHDLQATILHLLTDRPDRDPEWLSIRLREVAAGSGAPFGGHPLLAPLGAIDARCRAPSEVDAIRDFSQPSDPQVLS